MSKHLIDNYNMTNNCYSPLHSSKGAGYHKLFRGCGSCDDGCIRCDPDLVNGDIGSGGDYYTHEHAIRQLRGNEGAQDSQDAVDMLRVQKMSDVMRSLVQTVAAKERDRLLANRKIQLTQYKLCRMAAEVHDLRMIELAANIAYKEALEEWYAYREFCDIPQPDEHEQLVIDAELAIMGKDFIKLFL